MDSFSHNQSHKILRPSLALQAELQWEERFKSFKEYTDVMNKPLLNYQSESIKDIMNPKSRLYKTPTRKNQPDSHTLSPLAYPAHLRSIVDTFAMSKAVAYNFKEFVGEKSKDASAFTEHLKSRGRNWRDHKSTTYFGKKASELYPYDPNDEKLDVGSMKLDFEATDAELARTKRQHVQYFQ